MPDEKAVGNIAGPVVLEPDHFSLFDRLPRPVRQAFADCPYSIALREIVQFYDKCRGAGMEQAEIESKILERFKAFVERKVKEEVLKFYGPDHPQAGKDPQ